MSIQVVPSPAPEAPDLDPVPRRASGAMLIVIGVFYAIALA